MRPGRELDTKLAEEVFGHRVHVKKGILFEETPAGDRPLRKYTKEMEAAWEVADKMRIAVIPVEGGQWFALLSGGQGWKSPQDFIEYLQTGKFANAGAAVAEAAPLAICLAANNAIDARKAPKPENEAQIQSQAQSEPEGEQKITRIH